MLKLEGKEDLFCMERGLHPNGCVSGGFHPNGYINKLSPTPHELGGLTAMCKDLFLVLCL